VKWTDSKNRFTARKVPAFLLGRYVSLQETNMKRLLVASFWIADTLTKLRKDVEGSVFVEYLLLLTLVGIGVIAGLAAVRTALINELLDLANAINAISCP
jgi:Flp pilus assembly pilin Flp